MDIYIKARRKAAVCDKTEIIVADIAEVVAPAQCLLNINKMVLQNVTPKKGAQNFLISVIDVIKVIQAAYPTADISCVGEADTWVRATFGKTEKPLITWLKVAAVSVVLFVGAATAIMSFQTDGQIPKIFSRYHTLFTGEERENPPMIAIPYAIGLAAGILVFYNHVMGKKLTDDPTPIEVEIKKYEKDVTDAMLELLEKEGGNDG